MEDARTTDWLVAWDEARRRGEELSAADLCPDDPARQERLRRRIRELRKFYSILHVPDEPPGPDMPPTIAGPDVPPAAGAPTIAGLEVLEELGRGGMAVVFKARQPGLGRLVAVKLILAGPYSRPEQVARFRVEAAAIARLEHPHIVAIHDLGVHDGRPALVLEYMPGGTLAQRYAGAPQPPAEAARLVETLARAMHHAHGRGIVHRDLKPANILLSADGVPKVADFGLAKLLDDDDGTTRTGDILGTPSYMAPEQAEGRSRAIGPATDVHALGAILYEALTGRPPFQGTTKPETLELVRTQEPVPPRRLQPKIPRDLETICLTCLRKEPHRRYAAAADLADDLRRSLDGRPIRARRVGAFGRMVRWARRHPAVMTATGAGSTLVLMLLIGSIRAEDEARRRETASRVRTLVHTLRAIETARVPDRLRDLAPHRELARPLLREALARAPVGSRERLHAALALLPEDPGLIPGLAEALLVGSPEELALLCEALAPHRAAARDLLWRCLRDPKAANSRRLRAACALAGLDPRNPAWGEVGSALARLLIAEGPLVVGRWAELLRPVGAHTLPALAESLADGRGVAAERRVIAHLYATLAGPGSRSDALESFLDAPAGDLPEPEFLERTKGRANAAAALIAMGRGDRAWPLLRHAEDPTTRSYLIEAIPGAGVDPGTLLDRLESEPDVTARRALVLALGGFDLDRVVFPDRDRVVADLLGRYREEPDAGLHGALHWLLKRWGLSEDVRRIDRALEDRPPGERRWLVNGQGQIFSIVPIPPGAGAGRPYRLAVAANEVVDYRLRRAAAASRAVSWADPYPHLARKGGPALGVLRREAAAYCNWLSRCEGLPRDEWCYIPARDGDDDPLALAPDYLERAGYRLPTEAEWTHACLAGATTPYAYGRGRELLGRYGWWYGNADGHAWTVGLLKPNDFGLVDLYGNAFEHCEAPGADPDHVLCGGSFFVPSITVNLVDRNRYPPEARGESVGFRPVRRLRED